MTAEIAIMNKVAIALAADSAVTLEIQTRKSTDRKIYNSSNKLFTLSKVHPIGIMIYGNASLIALPWETIIKVYRKNLGVRKFDYLENYVDDFIKFLKSGIIPVDEQENYFTKNTRGYFAYIRDGITTEVKRFTDIKKRIAFTKIENICSQTIERNYKYLKGCKNLTDEFEKIKQEILTEKQKAIDEIIHSIFKELPLTDKDKKKLVEIAFLLLYKDELPSDISGVVIAGFGEKDLYPSLMEFAVDGVFKNILKYKKNKLQQVSLSLPAEIISFAQKEMVCVFMEGIDPNYGLLINGALTKIIDLYPKILLDKITIDNKSEKEKLKSTLIEEGKKVYNEISSGIDDYRQENFIQPVLNAVGFLPINELATMAETLVNLTSFKRKMSLDAETVGGPIDVAVISKGDGFIWIKRKHYFNPELNHHFFNNYFLECKEKEPENAKEE